MNRPHLSDLQNEEKNSSVPLPAADNALAVAMTEEARRREIEIGDDPQLLAVLARMAGEEQIPREFYVAIAAVLEWVDGLK